MPDITTIPPPDSIQEVSFESYVTRMIEHLKLLNNQFTTTKESDPAYALVQIAAYQISLKAEEINDSVRAVLLTTSSGADLDNLGVIYNERRRVITPGDDTVNPPIEEVLESDNNYRTRLLNSFQALALGSRQWYKKLVIESGSPFELTIKDLQVLGPEDSTDDLTIPSGEVWCYIEAISNINPIPTSTLVDQVGDYLDTNTLPDGTQPRLKSLERRFVGDTINVYSCIQKPYTISATITEASGLDRDNVIENIEEIALEFSKEYQRIGEKVPLSSIYGALDTNELLELDLHYPTGNIEPELNELPIVSIEFELEAIDYVTGINWGDFSDETDPKWSIIEESSTWYIVFTNGIVGDDQRKLQGVGLGRKFDILDKTDDPPENILSGQVVSILGTSDENSNMEDHYYLELSEEPTLTDIIAGELYVAFRSAIDIM